jgi:hypothetical protein
MISSLVPHDRAPVRCLLRGPQRYGHYVHGVALDAPIPVVAAKDPSAMAPRFTLPNPLFETADEDLEKIARRLNTEAQHSPTEKGPDDLPQDFHWADDPGAAARHDLQVMAPLLANLAYCPSLPDKTLGEILDWSDQLEQGDLADACSAARLQSVLPALTTAYLASHTYSMEVGENGDLQLFLHDQGTGGLLAEFQGLLVMLALFDLGCEGKQLLQDARADFTAKLRKIASMIAAR